MKLKKLASILLTGILLIGISMYAQASEITKSSFELEVISLDEIPDEITPLRFDTKGDAEEFLTELEKNVSLENKNYSDLRDRVAEMRKEESNSTPSGISTYSTNYNMEVDVWSAYSCKVKLSARYGTTKSGKVGTVTYVSPYTTFTGITLFASWNESLCDYYLYPSEKDAYIFAEGTVTMYFIIEDIGNFIDLPVSLGRLCHLAR